MAARKVVGVFLRDSYLCLECRLHRVVDDLGPNSLVVGRVVAACVRRDALRRQQRDDQDVIADRPLLAYLNPGRFAEIRESQGFPFPAGFKR
jgi:flavin reductase (DIM6/NTAB) family NADH-FMN oxidoreductase RutF